MNNQFSKRKNKKFHNAKKDASQKNKNFTKKTFNKKRHIKDKKYQITYSNEPLDNTDITMDKVDDNQELMKIGRYWNKRLILEPKNTSNQIYISEDEFIYSLCENSIKVLNFSDLSTSYEIKQENETIISFCRYEKKNEIIACMSNSFIRVFDLTTKKTTKIYKLNKVVGNIIKFDPTSKFFAVVCSNNTIIVYEYENGGIINVFQGHSNIIHTLIFNPDSNKFVFYTSSEDGTIRAWDIVLNKCMGVMSPSIASPIRSLVISNDGKTLISATRSGNINLWRTTDFSLIKQYNLNFTNGLSIDSILYLSRLNQTSKQIQSFLLLGCDDGTVVQFNFHNQDTNLKKKFINLGILYQYYNVNKKTLLILTQDQFILKVKIDLNNQTINEAVINSTFPGYCQEFLDVKILKHNETSDDFGNKLIFCSNDNYLKYVNLKTNQVKIFEGHKDFIMNIDIKENLIATCSKDGSVRLWIYKYVDNEFFCKNIFIFKGHTEIVNSLSISIRNKEIVSAGKDLSIKIWPYIVNEDSESYFSDEFKPFLVKISKMSEMGHEEEISVARYSPNEKLIVTAGYDKIIKVWDYNLKPQISLHGHKRAVTDVSFNKYAKIIASTSTDKNIKVWNLNDGTCLNTLEGHLTSVLKVFWVYYGTHLISSGGDGLIKFWNVKTSECINTVQGHEGKIWGIDLISGENFDKDKDLVLEKIKFFTAGTDSRLYEWTDITAIKEKELLEEEELQFQKKEILHNYIQNKDFLKALRLSLEMGRKRDFINIFKEYFNESKNTNDHIKMIIDNRKTLEEEKYENHVNYNKKIKEILSDDSLIEFFRENINKILEIVRDINLLSSSFVYAQVLLKITFLIENYQNFFNENITVGEKNKGYKYKKKDKLESEDKKIDFIENFGIIRSYSEKHKDRVNREIMKTYLIDNILEKMKLV